MEGNPEYVAQDWDDTADIPLIHMSYLIHILLPRRHFGQEQVLKEKQKVLDGFNAKKKEFSNNLNLVPVGSKSEGYAIPDAVKLTDNPHIEYMSDIDAMLVRVDFPIAAKEFKTDGTKREIFIQTSHTYPGYGRIIYTSPKDTNSRLLVHDKETDKYCLSSAKIIQGQLEMIQHEQDDVLEYSQQDPAISTDDPNPMTYDRGKTDELIHPQDYVVALFCETWPETADPWASRERNNDWLADDIVEAVVNSGFHMVPVAHKSSTNPDIEWRISFAKAEQLLAEQAVTSSQRQCYIYLKILRKQTESQLKLSSYCFKNVFLHCCEELPLSAWEDDAAGCVLYMLDVLIKCVQNRSLPSYFLPENNLIGHLNEEECYIIESTLQTMRDDPISPILEFTDSRIFCFPGECLSYSTTFRSITKFVLDEISSVEEIDIGRTVLGSFTDVQCNIASVMLGEKRSSFQYHVNFYHVFVKKYIQMAFVDFVNYMGIKLDSPFITLMFYERCISEVNSYPELECLRGNMACMCFALALTHDEKSKERKMRLYQAEKLYKEVLQTNGAHFASTIDYANFLCYNERWDDAVSLLEEFIDKEEKKPSFMKNGYYPAESSTLNKQLQREVKHTGCFLASSLSFAYYFLIKAYVQSNSPKISHVIQSFKCHCESVQTYGDYELLGYSGLDADIFELAEIAFSKAVNLHQNNQLAQVNLNLCMAQKIPVKEHTIAKKTLKNLLIFGNALTDNWTKVAELVLPDK